MATSRSNTEKLFSAIDLINSGSFTLTGGRVGRTLLGRHLFLNIDRGKFLVHEDSAPDMEIAVDCKLLESHDLSSVTANISSFATGEGPDARLLTYRIEITGLAPVTETRKKADGGGTHEVMRRTTLLVFVNRQAEALMRRLIEERRAAEQEATERLLREENERREQEDAERAERFFQSIASRLIGARITGVSTSDGGSTMTFEIEGDEPVVVYACGEWGTTLSLGQNGVIRDLSNGLEPVC